MKQQQLHSVNLLVPTSELGELFSWVAELSGTTLVSTEVTADMPRQQYGTVRLPNRVNVDDDALDPRLVYHMDEHGNARIDVTASLAALNLSESDLKKMKTRVGTSEHRVKMAGVVGKRINRVSNGRLGPAELKSGVLANRAA